jgi:fumarate hydratase class II
MSSTRTEKDTFGPIEVPADRLWGAQTQRSLEHFRISTERMPAELIQALAWVKRAAATVNLSLGVLTAEKAQAISAAADEVLAGKWPDEFPLAVWQTGSGTQSNMNMNEVLANRASELLGGERGEGRLVHPNDDVNRGQSSNDVFPTAMHVAAVVSLKRRLLPSLNILRATLATKSREFEDIVKIGRTHLQDATPLTLGQEFSGYVSQLDHALRHIEQSLPHLSELAIGGTAVGTGLNAHPQFANAMAEEISKLTAMEFMSAPNKFEALATHDAMVHSHGALKGLAVSLTKIANDIRLMGSGPRAGLAEIAVPELQKGSSIMPGKVNPVIPEVVTQVAAQVIGNDSAITVGGLQGHFELNVFVPVIARNLFDSIRLLSAAARLFAEKCVDGIEANRETCERYAELTLSAATALNPYIGYDKATEIVKEAAASGRSLREVAREAGVDEETLDKALDYRAMAKPHEKAASLDIPS